MGTPKKKLKRSRISRLVYYAEKGGEGGGRENNEHDEDTTKHYSLFIIHLREQQVWSHGCVIKR